MAIISGALLIEGPFMVILEWLGKLWPLALIFGGIALLWGARKVTSSGSKEEESLEADDITIEKLKTE